MAPRKEHLVVVNIRYDIKQLLLTVAVRQVYGKGEREGEKEGGRERERERISA